MNENSHIQWAIKTLEDKNYTLFSSVPEIIQDNAWSTVYRFKTNQGFIFLKKVPSALALEPEIINILLNEFLGHVPIVIAQNKDLDSFLMLDAGIQLHQFFKQQFDKSILIQTIRDYIKLQIQAGQKINRFLELGVPDWRLEKIPRLYQDLISKEELLINDGLTKSELKALQRLTPKLTTICEKLSKYNIDDTFGHADFHDKNILIDTSSHKTTIIDLGEVVVTHPFFSFVNCVFRTSDNFSLSAATYRQLQRECFAPWLEVEKELHLLEIIELIESCWPIHSVLGEYRLISSVDQSHFRELSTQGRLATNLRYWLAMK